MALIPIAHTRRLTSPAEAERFYRALGYPVVSARGFHTKDHARMARLVDAIEPKREHTITFEGGRFSKEARAALDVLALAPFQYLDVRTHAEDLRIWPDLHTWVHTKRSLAELGDGLSMGENDLPDGKVTLASHGPDLPINIETKSIPLALRFFHAHAEERLNRGFISGVKDAAKAPLLRFLEVLDTRVDAVLEVDVASARSLTELYAGERLDWQANMILVDFPEGKLHGFLTSSTNTPENREAWQARVTQALELANLL